MLRAFVATAIAAVGLLRLPLVVLAQGDGGQASSTGGGYVMAAYMVTALLLGGYGISLFVRKRAALADLAALRGLDPDRQDSEASDVH